MIVSVFARFTMVSGLPPAGPGQVTSVAGKPSAIAVRLGSGLNEPITKHQAIQLSSDNYE